MEKNKILPAIHINDVCKQMDVARIYGQTIHIVAWEQSGALVDYNGWKVSSGNWRGGWHKLINPVNGQVRTVPDCYIVKFNGHSMYL